MLNRCIALAAFCVSAGMVLGCGNDPAPGSVATDVQPTVNHSLTPASSTTVASADVAREACPVADVVDRVLQHPAAASGHIDAPATQDGVTTLPAIAASNDTPAVNDLSPVGGIAETLYLRERRKQGQLTEYYSWIPSQSEPRIEWSLPYERQDLVEGGAGDKIVIVRSGHMAPMADWELILKDRNTGVNCLLAKVDPDIIPFNPKTFGHAWALPTPSASGNRVVWAEWHETANGGFSRRIMLYDVDTHALTKIGEAKDAKTEGAWEPSINGERVAWLQKKDDRAIELMVRDLIANTQEAYSIPGEPLTATLVDDGTRFAWDVEDGSFVYDFASGTAVRYSNVGGYTLASGAFVSSWTSPDWIGYYSTDTGGFQTIDNRGATTIDAFTFGDYFVWQERRPDPSDPAPSGQKREISRYFAVRLGG